MKLNSEVIVAETKREMKYPCLVRSRKNGAIVLFVDHTIGMQLSQTLQADVGHLSNDWLSPENSEQWEILPRGTQVVLTVE